MPTNVPSHLLVVTISWVDLFTAIVLGFFAAITVLAFLADAVRKREHK